jgi:excisionase family DNA binding protein
MSETTKLTHVVEKVIIEIPKNVWENVVERIEALEGNASNLREYELSDRLVEIEEASRLLNVHPESVRRMIRAGTIRGEKQGGRNRISTKSINQYKNTKPRYRNENRD